MSDHEEHALDDILAELRGTHAEDQYLAALETLAQRAAHYYAALLRNGIGLSVATVLLLDFQRAQLGLQP